MYIYAYWMLLWVCGAGRTFPNFKEMKNSKPNPRTPAASRTTRLGLRVRSIKQSLHGLDSCQARMSVEPLTSAEVQEENCICAGVAQACCPHNDDRNLNEPKDSDSS